MYTVPPALPVQLGQRVLQALRAPLVLLVPPVLPGRLAQQALRDPLVPLALLVPPSPRAPL